MELEGSVLQTQRGFLERRKVKVLHEDLHYNSDYKPFRVLCISQALEGGGKVVEGSDLCAKCCKRKVR